jgi:hypothetical protein
LKILLEILSNKNSPNYNSQYYLPLITESQKIITNNFILKTLKSENKYINQIDSEILGMIKDSVELINYMNKNIDTNYNNMKFVTDLSRGFYIKIFTEDSAFCFSAIYPTENYLTWRKVADMNNRNGEPINDYRMNMAISNLIGRETRYFILINTENIFKNYIKYICKREKLIY